jgi:hypothetical protein
MGSCVSSVTTISANAWECGPGQRSNEGELAPQCEAARRALNRLHSCPSLRALTGLLCTRAGSRALRIGVCKDCPDGQVGNALDTACVWCPNGLVKDPYAAPARATCKSKNTAVTLCGPGQWANEGTARCCRYRAA